MNTPGLSFPWHRGFRFPMLLFGFVLLSALGHAVTFYLFHVGYPASVTLTPPPTRVVLLNPDTPENRAFLAWVADSDPALLARVPSIEVPSIGPFPYEPSYAASRMTPVLSPGETTPSNTELPDAVSGLLVMDRLLEPPVIDQPATAAPATKLEFSGGIAHRAPSTTPALAFEPVEPSVLSPTTFLLAINASGDTELVVLQSGSGQESLDLQAEKHVRALRFSSDETTDLLWGFATFVWGPEVQPLHQP